MRSVLTIAGSDPSGGAGLQGDLKTFAAHRVYGMAVVTAITVQNTNGVTRVEPVSADLVGAQLAAVLSDIDPDAIKIGMLGNAAIVRVVAAALLKHRDTRPRGIPQWHLVLDPVMSATQGIALLDGDGVTALREKLLPMATVVTPNTLEAERLTNMRVRSVAARSPPRWPRGSYTVTTSTRPRSARSRTWRRRSRARQDWDTAAGRSGTDNGVPMEPRVFKPAVVPPA